MSIAGFRPGLGRGGITHSLEVIEPETDPGVAGTGEAGETAGLAANAGARGVMAGAGVPAGAKGVAIGDGVWIFLLRVPKPFTR